MTQPVEPTRRSDATTTRAAVVHQINTCLAGQIDGATLAAWAFDRFYAAELGEERFEENAAPLIADVLDTLMFGDDPNFRLQEEELRALVAQLGTV
jgi:hypothetical protein